MKKLVGLILGLFLIGCTNPKEATESNFKDSIQAYFDEKQACFSVRASFPYEHEKKSTKDDLLEELVKIGMLVSEESVKVTTNIINKDLVTKEPAIKYLLTEKGNEVSEFVSKGNGWLRGETKFCYGQYKVEGVSNFSEPADFFGQKVSQVNFTYKVVDIADWANNDLFKSKSSELREDFNSTGEAKNGKAALILTNNGWVHEKLFKRGI